MALMPPTATEPCEPRSSMVRWLVDLGETVGSTGSSGEGGEGLGDLVVRHHVLCPYSLISTTVLSTAVKL